MICERCPPPQEKNCAHVITLVAFVVVRPIYEPALIEWPFVK